MDTKLQRLNGNGMIPTEAREAVRFWDNLAAQFGRGFIASQVMCGFALLELRDEAGVQRGGDHTSSASKANVFGFASWADFVEDTYAISDETARKRMEMARGVKSDFKKLGLADRFRALLATPPSQWSESDTKLLSDSLAKCTDGMTQTDFLQKLGLAKKKPGNPNAKGNGSRRLTTEEQRAKALELALEDSGVMGHAIAASNKNFFLLASDNDVEITAQIACLEFALKLRRKYLNTPRARRDDALVAEIEKLIKAESPLNV